MMYVNTLDALGALEYTDLDTEVDFSRIINEIDNNTIDTYELIDNERFIPLADWLVSDRERQYLDNIDMLDKEIDKALKGKPFSQDCCFPRHEKYWKEAVEYIESGKLPESINNG